MTSTGSDFLYHGTSSLNWEDIRLKGALRPGPFGHPHVSLTRDPQVARYFAELAAGAHEGQVEAAPVILSVRRSELEREGLTPTPFVDGIWGDEDGCEWELEEAVGAAIPARLLSELDLAGLEVALPRAEIIARRDLAELSPDSDPAPF